MDHFDCKALINASWKDALDREKDENAKTRLSAVFRFGIESIEVGRGCPLHPDETKETAT